MDREVAPGHDFGAPGFGRGQQRRPERRIDRVGHPDVATQQRLRHRRAAIRQHADRRSVDHADGTPQRVFHRLRNPHRLATAQLRRDLFGLGAVGIEDAEFGDTERRQRVCNRLADAAGADQGNGAMTGCLHEIADRALEPRGVGIVSDQPIAADDDRIDRADRARGRRQIVEQRNHGFLVGKRHVDPGKADALDAVEQRAQLSRALARDLDQLIVTADTQGSGRLLRASPATPNAQSGRRSGR